MRQAKRMPGHEVAVDDAAVVPREVWQAVAGNGHRGVVTGSRVLALSERRRPEVVQSERRASCVSSIWPPLDLSLMRTDTSGRQGRAGQSS